MAIETKLENVTISFSLQSAAFTKALLLEKKKALAAELGERLTGYMEIAECQANIRQCADLLEELRLSLTADLGVNAWETL